MSSKLNKIIYWIAIFLFTWVLISSLIYDSSQFYHLYKIISFIISLIVLMIWYLIYYYLKKKIPSNVSNKVKYLTLFVYVIIICIIELIIIKNLNVNPGWDFKVVFSTAEDLANKSIRNTVINNYFRYYPNNIFILLFEVICIRLGNLINISSMNTMYIVNICLINFSLVIFYLYLNKTKDYFHAFFGLILTFFFMPLFLYSPIFYSDTFSLFLPISILYIFSFINKNDNYVFWIILGILVFLSKEIKITALIIFIPLFLNYILSHPLKKSIINLSIVIIAFLSLNLVYNNMLLNKLNIEDNNDYGSYPFTHWIMMGVEDKDAESYGKLNAIGGYNGLDYDNSRAQLTHNATIKYNIDTYRNRVSKLGIIGYFKYLSRKVSQTWSDGHYYSDVALSINNIDNSDLYQFLYQKEPSKSIFTYVSSGIQIALLLSIILSSILLLKEQEKKLNIYHLTLIGLLIFFLFWENRSRYLYNYIPIFILTIIELYDMINLKKVGKLKMFKFIKKMFKKYKELIMYGIFGVLTTLVNIVVFYLLDKVGINTYLNNTIAWILSVLFAFVTNKFFVFESKAKDKKTIFKEGTSFFTARIFSYFVDMFTIYLLFQVMGINKMISKIISNVIVIIINYVLSKLFIFKKKEVK